MAIAQKPEAKEVLEVYGLVYDGQPARYIRDARSGDVGYHPGQPKQVIIAVEPTPGTAEREIRVPADQLSKGPDDARLAPQRAWPPINQPSPESERREAQRKADEERANPPAGKKGVIASPQIGVPDLDDEEEEVEEDEVDHKGEKTGKKTVKKVKKAAKK